MNKPITPKDDPAMPTQWPWMFHWFRNYSVRYMARHFHAVRLSKASHPLPRFQGEPILVILNHASWWDILISFVLSREWINYKHFAPIDAEMLKKYKIFAKLGLFPVEPTPRGAAQFLRSTRAIFAEDYRALWITGHGQFVDVRDRSVHLRTGIGYVASKLDRGFIVPIAIEYPFWDERTPECLVRIGEYMDLSEKRDWDKDQWTQAIEDRLTTTQDKLAADAIRRDPLLFTVLVQGRTGIGGVYDLWRRMTSFVRGKRFDPSHNSKNDSQ